MDPRRLTVAVLLLALCADGADLSSRLVAENTGESFIQEPNDVDGEIVAAKEETRQKISQYLNCDGVSPKVEELQACGAVDACYEAETKKYLKLLAKSRVCDALERPQAPCGKVLEGKWRGEQWGGPFQTLGQIVWTDVSLLKGKNANETMQSITTSDSWGVMLARWAGTKFNTNLKHAGIKEEKISEWSDSPEDSQQDFQQGLSIAKTKFSEMLVVHSDATADASEADNFLGEPVCIVKRQYEHNIVFGLVYKVGAVSGAKSYEAAEKEDMKTSGEVTVKTNKGGAVELQPGKLIKIQWFGSGNVFDPNLDSVVAEWTKVLEPLGSEPLTEEQRRARILRLIVAKLLGQIDIIKRGWQSPLIPEAIRRFSQYCTITCTVRWVKVFYYSWKAQYEAQKIMTLSQRVSSLLSSPGEVHQEQVLNELDTTTPIGSEKLGTMVKKGLWKFMSFMIETIDNSHLLRLQFLIFHSIKQALTGWIASVIGVDDITMACKWKSILDIMVEKKGYKMRSPNFWSTFTAWCPDWAEGLPEGSMRQRTAQFIRENIDKIQERLPTFQLLEKTRKVVEKIIRKIYNAIKTGVGMIMQGLTAAMDGVFINRLIRVGVIDEEEKKMMQQTTSPPAFPPLPSPGVPVSPEQVTKLAAGMAVVVKGLVSEPHFNGMSGVCQRLDPANGRWIVLLQTGVRVHIKPDNLIAPAAPGQALGCVAYFDTKWIGPRAVFKVRAAILEDGVMEMRRSETCGKLTVLGQIKKMFQTPTHTLHVLALSSMSDIVDMTNVTMENHWEALMATAEKATAEKEEPQSCKADGNSTAVSDPSISLEVEFPSVEEGQSCKAAVEKNKEKWRQVPGISLDGFRFCFTILYQLEASWDHHIICAWTKEEIVGWKAALELHRYAYSGEDKEEVDELMKALEDEMEAAQTTVEEVMTRHNINNRHVSQENLSQIPADAAASMQQQRIGTSLVEANGTKTALSAALAKSNAAVEAAVAKYAVAHELVERDSVDVERSVAILHEVFVEAHSHVRFLNQHGATIVSYFCKSQEEQPFHPEPEVGDFTIHKWILYTPGDCVRSEDYNVAQYGHKWVSCDGFYDCNLQLRRSHDWNCLLNDCAGEVSELAQGMMVADWVLEGCFPSDTLLEVLPESPQGSSLNAVLRPIMDIHVGDRVRTAEGFERVFAVTQWDPKAEGIPYLHIVVSAQMRNKIAVLRLTGNHMLPMGGQLLRADALTVGDKLLLAEGGLGIVLAITRVQSTGLHNLKTPSTTIAVRAPGSHEAVIVSTAADVGLPDWTQGNRWLELPILIISYTLPQLVDAGGALTRVVGVWEGSRSRFTRGTGAAAKYLPKPLADILSIASSMVNGFGWA